MLLSLYPQEPAVLQDIVTAQHYICKNGLHFLAARSRALQSRKAAARRLCWLWQICQQPRAALLTAAAQLCAQGQHIPQHRAHPRSALSHPCQGQGAGLAEGKQGELEFFGAQTGVNNHTQPLGFVLLSVTFAAVQDVPMSQKWLKAQANEAGACHESRVPNPCLSGDSGGLGAIPAPGPSSPAHLQAPAEKGSPGTGPCPALPLLLRKEGKVQRSLEWGREAEPPPSTYAYIKNEDIYRYLFWNTS